MNFLSFQVNRTETLPVTTGELLQLPLQYRARPHQQVASRTIGLPQLTLGHPLHQVVARLQQPAAIELLWLKTGVQLTPGLRVVLLQRLHLGHLQLLAIGALLRQVVAITEVALHLAQIEEHRLLPPMIGE